MPAASPQASRASDRSQLGAGLERPEPLRWRVRWSVAKFHGEVSGADWDAGLAEPYELIEREGNLLLIGGASALFECLIGNGTATAGQALTYFNNANARIGVGDSTTAAADTQTGLQAATNKTYKAMDATYPQHTDTTGTSSSKTITLRATFGTSDANYDWKEWCIDNGTRTLNRKQENLGTKTSAASWVFTVTVSLS